MTLSAALRRVAMLAAAVLAWSGLGVLTAPGAPACSCVGTGDRRAFDWADVVFTARLGDFEVDVLRRSIWDTTLTFHVDRVLKGPRSARSGS